MPWSKDWSGLKAAEAIADRLSIQRKDSEDLLPCMVFSASQPETETPRTRLTDPGRLMPEVFKIGFALDFGSGSSDFMGRPDLLDRPIVFHEYEFLPSNRVFVLFRKLRHVFVFVQNDKLDFVILK